MTKDEALRLALEALEYAGPSWIEARQPAITAIKAALEAKDDGITLTTIRHPRGKPALGDLNPESLETMEIDVPEPVAWFSTLPDGRLSIKIVGKPTEGNWEPLYTTPPQRKPLTVEQPEVRTGNCLRVGVCASEGHKIQPQRTWVGLTDEEIWETISRIGTSDSDVNPYAKLADARAIEAKLKEKNT
jgi:hypothetical protein